MPVCLYICQVPKEEHIHPLNLTAIAKNGGEDYSPGSRQGGPALTTGTSTTPEASWQPPLHGTATLYVHHHTATLPQNDDVFIGLKMSFLFLNLDVFYIYMISI